MTFGENLKRIRTERGFSVSKLARSMRGAVETNRRSVFNWENCAFVPSMQSLINVADALMVTIDELVGRQPPLSEREQALLEAARKMLAEEPYARSGLEEAVAKYARKVKFKVI